jgi:Protein of unknown function (DUF2490)
VNYIIIIILVLSPLAYASELDLYGTRPFISLTKLLGARFEVNAFYAETVNGSNEKLRSSKFTSRDIQSYFQTGLTYKVSPNLNLSAGYVFQRNNPFYKDFSNENRLWQQMIVVHPVRYFSLAHRFRFEERFIDNRSTKNTDPLATRLRYQVSFTAPLQGKTVDPGEFLFNTYNESYFSTTGQRSAFYSENWTYAGLGYQTTSLGRLEIGPLVQWAKINQGEDTRMIYLLQVGWSYTF